MSKFDSYFLMKATDAAQYAVQKVTAFDWDISTLQSEEIGDGNLNYIFRVYDAKGNSVVIKQAGHELRISKEMKLSLDRNRIESEMLILEDRLAPGFVPKIYFYDTVMSACCMEDLTGHKIMRYALMDREIYADFAQNISTFMAGTLMGTTDVVMNHIEKKELQRKYINPELCEITEDLVYTEPYQDIRGRNNVFAPNLEFVKRELYEDAALHLEVAKLKFAFMTNAQALIHGDLHTGSIFIKPGSMKVIDPEFAFYGPIGYDVGNVVANLIFAWCNGRAQMKDGEEKRAFCGWLLDTMRDTVDLTIAKMAAIFERDATEPLAKTRVFRDYYMASILEDTAGVVGLELNRRTVGMANVKDLTTIADEKARIRAERTCILAAKAFIKKRSSYRTGQQFVDTLCSVAASVWEG